MDKQLLAAVLSLKSRVGNFSHLEYEFFAGKPWDLFFKGVKISYLGETTFLTCEEVMELREIASLGETIYHVGEYRNKFSYTELEVDTLLDLYLVMGEMEDYLNSLQTEVFWEERVMRKGSSGRERGKQCSFPILGEGDESELHRKWNKYAMRHWRWD